jgi:hypothetical protein
MSRKQQLEYHIGLCTDICHETNSKDILSVGGLAYVMVVKIAVGEFTSR